MRLLVVTAQFPYPPRSGGAIVAWHHLDHLARRHEVHLLARGAPRPAGELEARLASLEFVDEPPRPWLARQLHTAGALLGGVPPSVSTFAAPRLSRRVAARWGAERFDALILFELGALQYCPPESHPRVVANVEDPQAIRFGRMRRLEVWSRWQRLKLAVLEASSRRYERRLLGGLGRVLVLSPADARALAAQGGYGNVGQVRYGVAAVPPEEVPGRSAREPGVIVISGNMFHPPNVDGVLHFLRAHLPRVRHAVPDARLWIVGADPDRRIVAAAGRAGGVTVTGRVEDVSAHLRRAMVSVCPVRLEIGVQTKVLEAMAWGTPVVTTSAGNAGIGARAGEEAWVEDDEAALAGRVAALLQGEGWERLSRGGARLAAERFSWALSGQELEGHLEAVAAAAPSIAPSAAPSAGPAPAPRGRTGPRVSVALATFDGARHLPAQLESIAAQTILPDELVVGDDGSTDGTAEVVAAFARRGLMEVRFTRNPARLGSTRNFAACLERCRGEVILLCDQDDAWAPERVAATLSALEAAPHAAYAFSDAALMDEAGRALPGRLWARAFFDEAGRAAFREGRGHEVLLRTNVVTGATMGLRREALAGALPIPEGWVHDAWLAFLLELRHGAVPIEAPLVRYRLHPGQQIGVLRPRPAAVLALLRRQDAAFYRREAANHLALAARLEALARPGHPEVPALARRKAAFLEARAAFRDAPLRALGRVAGALWRGDYRRFGLGWRQAAFDLLGAALARPASREPGDARGR